MGVPSGTVTFLFTDIEGSTRLWQQDEEAMRAAVARHDELLTAVIVGRGGEVFSTMGDGVAAAFSSAAAAVAAALEAQRLLAAELWPTSEPVRVRMGLHTGEAERRGDDYFGSAVNRAARLMAIGHGGQVLCSGATAGLVESEVPLVDLGEHRLRDLDRPMHVFQVGGSSFAQLRSLDAFPGNLPVQLTSFVGRDRELATVVDALRSSRIVTLTGTGGVGKTRLAVQAAANALPEFGDGAWLCELAAAADSDAMLQVVAIALGFTPRQDVSLAQAIAEFLGSKRLLVVLDNCEHLLDAAAELVEAIIDQCPEVRLIATSREPLDVSGERVVRLRSLAVPKPGATLEELALADAARLFIDRAEATGGDVTLGPADAAAVAEICRRLDGIPLAIELAAARVIALSPAEIAAHLDERFRLLTGGRRAAVERHHTLRATVDWSYSLLGATEQRVYERLGVFPASFDAAAAQAVAEGDGIEGWDVVDALTSLVAKSMLVAERTAQGSTRYQMLETLRHYAREQLDAAGEADQRRRMHARHYADCAAEIGAGLMGADDLPWRARLQAELDNFRAAVFWGLDSRSDEDAGLALRIIGELMPGGEYGRAGIGSWAEQAVEHARRGDPRYRGAVLAGAAANALWRGDPGLSSTLAAEALRAGTVAGSSYPAGPWGPASIFMPAEGQLAAHLAEGVAALERIGASTWNHASLRAAVATMAALRGHTALASAEAAEALRLGRQLDNQSLIVTSLWASAHASWRDRPQEALAALEEVVGLIRKGHANMLLPRTLALSAQLRAASGDATGARRDLRDAINAAHATGDRPGLATAVARGVSILAGFADWATALEWAGAVNAGVLARLHPLSPHERADFRAAVDHARSELGTEFSDAAFARGAAMPYDAVVTSALATLDGLRPVTSP